jgi:lipoprotein-anchoring transpeptidase ErfK/SrfK
MKLRAALVASTFLCAIQPSFANDKMGGGFISFLFSDADRSPAMQRAPQGQRRLYAAPQDERGRYLVQPGYGERRAMLPGFEPDEPRAMMQPQSRQMEPAQPALDPKYEKQVVSYDGREKAGTIVVDTPNKFLYLVQGDGRALRYGIGVGRPGFTWSGVKTITAKKEWPSWTPPAEMLARRPDLPRFMEGGPENPLGARAMYLGSTLYRIHGSNEPWTIGTNVSSGCIRMRNEDVIDLYGRVGVGAKVVVI